MEKKKTRRNVESTGALIEDLVTSEKRDSNLRGEMRQVGKGRELFEQKKEVRLTTMKKLKKVGEDPMCSGGWLRRWLRERGGGV